MNRNHEYDTLLRQLEQTPPELEHTVQRAKSRAKKRHLRWLALPAAAAAVFAAFVVMVNTSVSFAYAMADIPVLGDLMAFVEYSRYMADIRSAVKNDHAKVIGQQQTVDGLTVTVEYAIVDPWQIDLFVRTENENENLPYTRLELSASQSDDSFSFREDENGWLRRYVLNFYDGDIPRDLSLQFQAWPAELVNEDSVEEPIVFDFNIAIEEKSISPVRTVEIGQWITNGDQRIWLDRLEITRSQTWLVMDGAPENSAWLSATQIWVRDENGDSTAPTFERGTDESGEYIVSLGKNLWNFDSDQLQLNFKYLLWESKDTTEVVIDTVSKTAVGLPDWLTLEDIYVKEDASYTYYYKDRPLYYYDDATVLRFSCPSEMLEKVYNIGDDYDYLSPFTYSMHGCSEDSYTTVHFELHCYQNTRNPACTYEDTLITLKLGSSLIYRDEDDILVTIPLR